MGSRVSQCTESPSSSGADQRSHRLTPVAKSKSLGWFPSAPPQVECSHCDIASFGCGVSTVDVHRLASEDKNFGAVCGHDGVIYAAPFNAHKLLIYDIKSSTLSSIELPEGTKGLGKFSGMCLVGDKIVAAPSSAKSLVVYSISSNTITCVDVTKSAVETPRFSGICSVGSKVYAAPSNADKLLVYDVESGHMSHVDISKAASGTFKFNGICSLGSRVYAAPCSANKLLEYDTESGQVSGIDVSAIAAGDQKFSGICACGNKVYAAPCNSDKLLVYDTESASISSISVLDWGGGPMKFNGICSVTSSVATMLYLAPCNSQHLLVLDPKTNLTSSVDISAASTGKFKFSSVCAVDGKVYAAPLNCRHLLMYDTDPSNDDLRKASESCGISLHYLLHIFPGQAQSATGCDDPTFREMQNAGMVDGNRGKGIGQQCPRDLRPGCSFVDAVETEHRGRATHFLSWSWGYKLLDFTSALESWATKQREEPQDIFLWICFFCNNQYRILDEQSSNGSDDLGMIFEKRLKSIGKVIVMLDDFREPLYVTRAWCIFETFMATKNEIEIDMILPQRAEEEFKRAGMEEIGSSFGAIDVEQAKATFSTDEERVKRLIETTVGFDKVNETVKSKLRTWLVQEFKLVLGGS